MDINTNITMSYIILGTWRGGKTKPIQTQFKANLSQFKPKQTQFKAKQSQFIERAKMNPFAWIRSLTIVLLMLLAEFTTLKGANFKRGAHERREEQIIIDLASGISIKSYVTQKSSVVTEIMRKG